MECNKEEAVRVKGMAEKKMESKDYVDAHRLILKAQRLFPDLENLMQMMTVCTVHVSAETKFQGTEMDWYRILQVEAAADEASIRKQYRRLALLLHPDKNKFPGAESAFKLIGEAMRILLDQSKRALYDIKRRQATTLTRPGLPRRPAQPNHTATTNKTPGFSSASVTHTAPQFAGLNRPHMQQQPPSAAGTFWTMCPYCSIRYQYYSNVMNKTLKCQTCKSSFVARDISIPSRGFGSETVLNRSSYPQQNGSIDPGGTFGHQKVPQPAIFKGTSFGMGFQPNVSGVSMPSKNSDEVRDAQHRNNSEAEKVVGAERAANMEKHTVNDKATKKQRKVVSDSSDSDSADSEESDEVEEVDMEQQYQFEQQAGASTQHPRRSSRNKKYVSYNENKSDDEIVRAPRSKRSKRSEISEGECKCEMGSSQHLKSNGEDPRTSPPEDEDNIPKTSFSKAENKLNSGKLETNNANSSINGKREDTSESVGESDEDHESSSEPKTFDVPETEFYDFDADKAGSRFISDQVWAVYDDLDGLPRFYAIVRKVLSTDFQLEIRWLESSPVGAKERAWKNAGLPIACGRFSFGKAMFTEDRLMFSHLTKCERIYERRRNYCQIYPRKGEIWAIFQDWDINWISDPENHKSFKYEVVEMLSDYTDDTGGNAAPLVKVNGFQSLFKRMVNSKGSEVRRHMPDGQSFKFSHQVPAHRMEGGEKEGVPGGSFELDPAALPSDFLTSLPSSKTFEGEVGGSGSKNSWADPSASQHAHEHKDFVFGEQKPKASPQKGMKDGPKRKDAVENECITMNCHYQDGLYMNGVSDKRPEQANADQQQSDGGAKVDTRCLSKSLESSPKVYTRQSKVTLASSDNNPPTQGVAGGTRAKE